MEMPRCLLLTLSQIAAPRFHFVLRNFRRRPQAGGGAGVWPDEWQLTLVFLEFVSQQYTAFSLGQKVYFYIIGLSDMGFVQEKEFIFFVPIMTAGAGRKKSTAHTNIPLSFLHPHKECVSGSTDLISSCFFPHALASIKA